MSLKRKDVLHLINEERMVGELILGLANQVKIGQSRFDHEKISTLFDVTLSRTHGQPVASGRKLVRPAIAECRRRFGSIAERSVEA